MAAPAGTQKTRAEIRDEMTQKTDKCPRIPSAPEYTAESRDEMTAETDKSGATDQALSALVALLRFHGVGADVEQIRHRVGAKAIGIPEILRCAKELGLKARSVTTRWERLANTPMPAIAALRDGRFLIIGKIDGDRAL